MSKSYWYIQVGDDAKGPYTVEQIRQLASSADGLLDPDHNQVD